MSAASSLHFLSRDVIFIFKRLKLKTEGYNSVTRKRLHFVMKAGGVSIALYGAEDYPLFPSNLSFGERNLTSSPAFIMLTA